MINSKRGSFSSAYGRSMKLRGMDGPVDLFIYRPIGFLIAWVLSFTRARPNAVTLISVALGVAAGAAALSGSVQGFLLCALIYQVSNCFDCADGQLARLTGTGTPEGRIIDGLGDTLVNIVIFLCVVLGLVKAGHPAGATLALAAAAGVAKVVSSMYYDRAITRYAERMEGSPSLEPFDELADSRERAAASSGWRRALWQVYALYLGWQGAGKASAQRKSPVLSLAEEGKPAYQAAVLPLLSLWSFSGPSSHVLYFLVFAAIGKIQYYFETSIVLVALTCVCLVLEQIVDLRMKPYLEAAPLAPALGDDSRSR